MVVKNPLIRHVFLCGWVALGEVPVDLYDKSR